MRYWILMAALLGAALPIGTATAAEVASDAVIDEMPTADAPADAANAAPLVHDDMVVVALSLIGTPYQYGGESPETGFDCSGLVQYILGLSSPIKLPRTANDMYHLSSAHSVKESELKAGDLLFFRIGHSKRINHVAVYIGENRFVHAPSRGNVVRVDQFGKNYWQRYYVGAKRVLPENDLLAVSRH